MPDPDTRLKFTVVPLCGLPLLMTRTVSGKANVAPCATNRDGVTTPISNADSVPSSDPETVFDGLYTPGASVAVMPATPAAVGVIAVDASPLSSVIVEQEVAPLQIESAAPLVLFQPTVAPATGVTPSAATTCTTIG